MAVDHEAEAQTNGAPKDEARTNKAPANEAPTSEAPGGSQSRGGRAGRVIVSLVIVALLVAAVVLGHLLWQDHRQDELRRSAAEDASRLVVQLATYDHTNVDAHLDAVVAEATPGFADRYREVSEGLRELLASGQGTSAGTVSHAAVESLDGDTAVVLVFLDQEVSNVTVPDGRVDSSRMVVTVVRDGDGWLLEDAQLA